VLIAENDASQAEQEATSALELVVLEGYAKGKEKTAVLVSEKANQNKEVLLNEKVEIEKEIIEASQDREVSQQNIEESTKIISQTKKQIDRINKGGVKMETIKPQIQVLET